MAQVVISIKSIRQGPTIPHPKETKIELINQMESRLNIINCIHIKESFHAINIYLKISLKNNCPIRVGK